MYHFAEALVILSFPPPFSLSSYFDHCCFLLMLVTSQSNPVSPEYKTRLQFFCHEPLWSTGMKAIHGKNFCYWCKLPLDQILFLFKTKIWANSSVLNFFYEVFWLTRMNGILDNTVLSFSFPLQLSFEFLPFEIAAHIASSCLLHNVIGQWLVWLLQAELVQVHRTSMLGIASMLDPLLEPRLPG